MRVPVQISFDGVDSSESLAQRIRLRVAKLERFCPDIIGCRVTIGKNRQSSTTRSHKGEPYHVSIDVSVPGDSLVVRRDPEHGDEAHDVSLVLHHAFDTMGRKVKDYAGRRRS